MDTIEAQVAALMSDVYERLQGPCLVAECGLPAAVVTVSVIEGGGTRVVWTVCEGHRWAVQEWTGCPDDEVPWYPLDRAPQIALTLLEQAAQLHVGIGFPNRGDWHEMLVLRLLGRLS